MSSLQKFHRRTLVAGGGAGASPFTAIGAGNDTVGWWLGNTVNSNKLIVGPASSGAYMQWNTSGAKQTYITNTTDGLTNTYAVAGNAYYSTAVGPIYCTNLTTGGYNTWYMPAINELLTLYSNKAATPFATTNTFVSGKYYWSSTEPGGYDGRYKVMSRNLTNGGTYQYRKMWNTYLIPVRRTTV